MHSTAPTLNGGLYIFDGGAPCAKELHRDVRFFLWNFIERKHDLGGVMTDVIALGDQPHGHTPGNIGLAAIRYSAPSNI